MELSSYFSDFLKEIRLTQNHIDDLKTGHETLRERLCADERLSPIIVNTFLQGSYRRSTAVRPCEGKRADVDVVVVTKLSQQDYPDPQKAMDVFIPFLDEHYKDKYELQGRSIGISLSYVDLDLVITSAPSESEVGILGSESVTATDTLEEAFDWRLNKSWISLAHRAGSVKSLLEASKSEPEWKLSPLYIPDREAKAWQPTHPLEQIKWTRDKNRCCNSHYVNVVKALKWWRRVKHEKPKYPKGYPVEHLIGDCCPDGILSVAQGIVLTLEAIAVNYQVHATLKMSPDLRDRGVLEHNVFKRVSGEDFAEFHAQVSAAAKIARKAFNANTPQASAAAWQELFGDKFPDAPESDDDGDNGPGSGGYTPRTEKTTISGSRFA